MYSIFSNEKNSQNDKFIIAENRAPKNWGPKASASVASC